MDDTEDSLSLRIKLTKTTVIRKIFLWLSILGGFSVVTSMAAALMGEANDAIVGLSVMITLPIIALWALFRTREYKQEDELGRVEFREKFHAISRKHDGLRDAQENKGG